MSRLNTSTSTQSPQSNNQKWETFLFTVCNEEEQSDPQFSTNALYDAITSGIRRKFSVIKKADLVSWALQSENQKQNEFCRELKQFVESNSSNDDNGVPDRLMAKVLKARLGSLRQEGIESRNDVQSGVNKESSEDSLKDSKKASAPAKEKEKEKDAKEKKDERVKSSPKKGGAKGNAKPIETVSRPQSAQSIQEPPSKRKTKLREKAPKVENKQTAIDDEPTDGPDAYYWLKDLNSPGILNSLMKENDVQINAVFRIYSHTSGRNEGNVQQASANSRNRINFQNNENISGQSLYNEIIVSKNKDITNWRNVAFVNMDTCAIPKSTENENVSQKQSGGKQTLSTILFDYLARRVYDLLELRKQFRAVFSDPSINIPAMTSEIEAKLYNQILNMVDSQAILSVELIFGILLEQIVHSANFDEKSETITKESESSLISPVLHSSEKNIIAELRRHIDELASKLPIKIDRNSSSKHHTDMVGCKESDGLISSKSIGFNAAEILSGIQYSSPLSRIIKSLESLKLENKVLEQSIFGELKQSRKLYSTVAANVQPTALFAQAEMISEFENILEHKNKSEVDLSAWCWREYYSDRGIVREMQNLRPKYPCLYYQYCARLGMLLVLMKQTPQDTYPYYKKQSTTMARTKVGFGLFNEHYTKNPHFFETDLELGTPAATDKKPIYATNDKIIAFKDCVDGFYLADGSRLQCRSLSLGETPKTYYMTFSKDENLINWNKTDIIACIEGGTFCAASRTIENSGVVFQIAMPDGLVVQFLSNGNVLQKLLPEKQSNELFATNNEIGRIYVPEGDVIKYYASSTELLSFNGKFSVQSNTDEWLTTEPDGSVYSQKNNEESTLVKKIKSVQEHHITDQNFMLTREDNVQMKVNLVDGSMVCHHSDGTRFFCKNKGGSKKIEIYSENFAEVCFEEKVTSVIAANGTVFRCVRGEKQYQIEVTKSEIGLTVRSDGSAEFSSKLKCHQGSPDRYMIDWKVGKFYHRDKNDKEYIASGAECKIENAQNRGGLKPPQSEEILIPGKCVQQAIENYYKNTYIEEDSPVLFAISEKDGCGYQLLRDRDLALYFVQKLSNPKSEISEEAVYESGGSMCVTVVEKVDGDRTEYRQSKLDRKSMRENIYRKLGERNNSLQGILLVDDKDTSQNSIIGLDQKCTVENVIARIKQNKELNKRLISGEEILKDQQESAKEEKRAHKKEFTEHVVVKKLIQGLLKEGDIIPDYFESKEGKPHATENATNQIPLKENTSAHKDVVKVVEEKQEQSIIVTPVTDPNSSHSNTFEEKETIIQNIFSSLGQQHVRLEQAISMEKQEKQNPMDTDVIGNPRQKKVHKPHSIRKANPEVELNEQYLSVEGETRRKVATSSTAMVARDMRTFEVFPGKCVLGCLEDGCQYKVSISIKNVSNISTRFRVRYPEGELKSIIVKSKPGAVAPGISSKLEVIVTASLKHEDTKSDSTGKGRLTSRVQIITETEIITVPVLAEVQVGAGPGGVREGVQLLTTLAGQVHFEETRPPQAEAFITAATWLSTIEISDMFRVITAALRSRENNWVIVFKGLVVAHIMLREGDSARVNRFLSVSRDSLDIGAFRDKGMNSFGASQTKNIRAYASYLEARVAAYKDMNNEDVISNKDLVIARIRSAPLKKDLILQVQGFQKLIDSLLGCSFYKEEVDNVVTLQAFRLLIADMLSLFHLLNEGVIRILGGYFELPKSEATLALQVYKQFASQTSRTVQFFEIARNLQGAPASLAGTLEDYLKSPDFETQRAAYLERKKNPKQSASAKETKAPSSPTRKETVTQPEPKKAETKVDFFASLDEEINALSSVSQNAANSNLSPFGMWDNLNGIQDLATNPFLQQQQMQLIQLQQQQQQLQLQQMQLVAASQFGSGQVPFSAVPAISPFGMQNAVPAGNMSASLSNPFATNLNQQQQSALSSPFSNVNQQQQNVQSSPFPFSAQSQLQNSFPSSFTPSADSVPSMKSRSTAPGFGDFTIENVFGQSQFPNSAIPAQGTLPFQNSLQMQSMNLQGSPLTQNSIPPSFSNSPQIQSTVPTSQQNPLLNLDPFGRNTPSSFDTQANAATNNFSVFSSPAASLPTSTFPRPNQGILQTGLQNNPFGNNLSTGGKDKSSILKHRLLQEMVEMDASVIAQQNDRERICKKGQDAEIEEIAVSVRKEQSFKINSFSQNGLYFLH
ncbi:hypothetical protein HK098_000626 [Nowakowskiella sp. JEL0407]|nr:hypothetical protein HK098_000626 [Nowakowskiella sp. JEL0407]